MTNLTEQSQWESGVFQLETDTPTLGGPPGFNAGLPVTGHANAQAQQLANRTKYLKDQHESFVSQLSSPTGAEDIGFETRTVSAELKDEINFLRYVTPAIVAAQDYSLALQAAVDAVKAQALTQGKPYGLPRIVVPGGLYPMKTTVTTYPWINIISKGSVLFDWSDAANNVDGFVCNNDTTLLIDDLKYPANHSYWLDGSNGAISILGTGRSVSTSVALKVGNFTSGKKQFRDAGVRCVVVTGWYIAQEWGAYDTYLARTEDCRFEINNIAISTQRGITTASNSGERMTWQNCTFSGSDFVFNHNIDGFDCNFVNCSFDFNTDVIKYGASSRFTMARFVTPHIEALDGYIVNGTDLVSSVGTGQVSVSLVNPIILSRAKSGSTAYNSPSRKLFKGKYTLSILDVKMRHEARPYLEDGSIIDSDVEVITAKGYHASGQRGPLRLDGFVNPDFSFQKDPVGTSADTLTNWERIVGLIGGTINTRDIFDLSGKKVLRLVATTGTDTSSIHFRSKNKISCRAGDVFWANLSLQAENATGAVSTRAWVEFFDDSDVSLGSFPSFAQYDFRDALNDATLPNYAEGNSRFMDTSAFRAIAPQNTAYAKMRFAITAFDGTVYVSRARMWKD